MITALKLLRAIRMSDWSRYTGDGGRDADYATAGTTGMGAIELRCPLSLGAAYPAQPIEYRHVGSEGPWMVTGYRALVRYDTARKHVPDGDGYYFVPYKVTELTREYSTT